MKDKIITFASELIRIPSIAGDIDTNIEALELIKKQLTEFPFTAFASNGIPSLLYSNKKTQDRHFRILFNLHLDVVPGAPETFFPRVENGKLYGRGAYDMKAAAATMILVFKEVGKQLPYNLGLQVTTDEEIAGENGTKHQIGQGVRADFVITGESGSNLGITHESKARIVIQLIAKGKTSHSGYPWLGDNALVKLQQALHEIITQYPLPKKEAYQSTVNITHITTNNSERALTGYNKTPHYGEAIVDVRAIPDDIERIVAEIQSLVEPYVEMKILHITKPHVTPKDNLYIQNLQTIGKQLRSKEFPYIKAHATSDVRHFAEIDGQGIEFGPIGKHAHEDREWVDIASLEAYYQILKAFLLSIK